MGSLVAQPAPGPLGPLLDGPALPDVSSGQDGDGPREVGAADELVHTLAADPEKVGDLGRRDEMVHGRGP